MIYQTIKNKSAIVVSSQQEWRQWLDEHHYEMKEIWLVYYKKHADKLTLTKNEAIDEAICFGWIDSIVQGIDDERYMQKFTPRKQKSTWSVVNKKRVEVLEFLGLIQPSGLRLIEEARKSGEWDQDRRLLVPTEIPQQLARELDMAEDARLAWEKLTPSHRKQFLLWINQAKREETRKKRCKKAIIMLTSSQSPNML